MCIICICVFMNMLFKKLYWRIKIVDIIIMIKIIYVLIDFLIVIGKGFDKLFGKMFVMVRILV